jgi:hypothetical protein
MTEAEFETLLEQCGTSALATKVWARNQYHRPTEFQQ